jgi:YfiH family protein
MGIELVRPGWRIKPSIQVTVTTRSGGVSADAYQSLNLGSHVDDAPAAVLENRLRLSAATGVGAVGWLDQVHGTRVVQLRRPLEPSPPSADASWTTEQGLACAVLTADCLPVVVADTGGSLVGVAHCGWRGLVAGVLENLLSALPRPDGELVAWLGPGICGRCYEVGADVREAVTDQCGEAIGQEVLIPGAP